MAGLQDYAENDDEDWDLEQDLQVPEAGLVAGAPFTLDLADTNASPEQFNIDAAARELDAEWSADLDSVDRDDRKTSSLDSTRTDSTTDTLNGMMDSLTLTEGDDATAVLRDSVGSSASTETALSPSERDLAGPETPRAEQRTTTLRASSSLSILLASASRSPSGRGKVHHLGSTKAKQVDDADWDKDLEGLGSLQLRGAASAMYAADAPVAPGQSRVVCKKSSFASHISLEDEDRGVVGGILGESHESPVPTELPRRRISIASFSDADEDLSRLEDDFDLPGEVSHLSLAPKLVLSSRASISSLSSDLSSSFSPPAASSAAPSTDQRRTAGPPSGHSAPDAHAALSPHRPAEVVDDGLSSSAAEDDDADFFEDLVLPSYFLGSTPEDPSPKTPFTPPTSEGELDSDHASSAKKVSLTDKVDLQAILREKLELRGGRGLLFGAGPGSAAGPGTPEERERLERHREQPDEVETAQLADELGRPGPLGSAQPISPTPAAALAAGGRTEASWTAAEMRERMRTISGARAREAQLAQEARAAQRANSGRRLASALRRTASEGKVPAPPSRRRDPPAAASLAADAVVPGHLGLVGFDRGQATIVPQPSRGATTPNPHRQIERPASAASSRSTESNTQKRRPPPAPSAASRGRQHPRTASLRATASALSLSSASVDRARPLGHLDVGPAPSSTPGRSSLLKSRRSQQQLSSTAVVPSTSQSSSASPAAVAAEGPSPLHPRRSLQGLSALASPPSAASRPASGTLTTRPSSRQLSMRSPSPARPGLPSYAAPTAASNSRVRERVQSLPSNAPPPSPIPTSTLSGFVRPIPTPVRGPAPRQRYLQVAARPASRSSSPVKPSLAPSPRLPTALATNAVRSRAVPTHYSILRPVPVPTRVGRQYGDGTELDAFDDLPVSKEREKERTVLPASRKSSGASSATAKNGSWGRRDGAKASAAVKRVGVATGPELDTDKVAGTLRAGDSERKKSKRRREPHLIRHLGNANAVKGRSDVSPLLAFSQP